MASIKHIKTGQSPDYMHNISSDKDIKYNTLECTRVSVGYKGQMHYSFGYAPIDSYTGIH